jgi:hypothetical protein
MIKYTTLECEQCNIEFNKPTSEYNRQLKRNRSTFFCSLECSGKYESDRRDIRRIHLYNENPKRCRHCDKTITYEHRKNKYCNQSCSAKSNNPKHIRKRKHEKSCKNCSVTHYKVGPFCGHACSVRYKRNEIDRYIIDGNAIGHVTIKKFLIKTHGNKCEMCGISDWNGRPIMLVLDHINGDSSNNELTNLRLLCSNCDAQTPTYKGRNAGKGRHSRRQRYAENKSY